MVEDKNTKPKDCPICKSNLIKHTTVMLKGTNIRIIGHHYFCPTMNCNYEEDTNDK